MKIDFFVKTIHSSLFVANLNLSNKISVAKKLTDSTLTLFDGEPLILPIPNDAPPEIPRIILKNREETISCNLSLNRIDFVWNEKADPSRKIEEVSEDYLDGLFNATKVLKNGFNPTINRLGFIATFFVYLEESATAFLSRTFIKNGYLSDSKQIQLGALRLITVDAVDANRWIRLSPLTHKETGKDTAISIIVDINTPLEILYDFKLEDIKRFYKQVVLVTQKSLESHFQKRG